MPMLADTTNGPSASSIGWLSASRMRAAVARAAGSVTLSSSTPNSSPPSRAAVSGRAGRRVSRRATSCSRRSPSAWPRASLAALKSSRSTNRTPTSASGARPAQRVLDAVVEQRAVGQSGERVVEGAVAQLLLERLALFDVAGGDDDAPDPRVAEQVGRDRGDVPVRAVRVAHAPLRLLRLVGRLGRHALQEGADERDVVRMHPLEQWLPCAASQSGPKIGCTSR